MRFSIVTPSFRNSRWLKLCIPSVADQAVEHEHLVQDSCSDDGTGDWLPKDPRVQAFIEKDNGMYDAVNRGLRRAQGGILAYLNCDEQYLPGALVKVEDFFRNHPGVDVVFGHTVVIDAQGGYLCHRKGLVPEKFHTWANANLCTFTCSTFFRRSLIDKLGLFFDARFKAAGDAEWMIRAIDKNVSMAVLPDFTSAFTRTGANMNDMPNARREADAWMASAPAWARRLRSLLLLKFRLRKCFAGGYQQPPFDYSIYTEASPGTRVAFHVDQPTQKWVV